MNFCIIILPYDDLKILLSCISIPFYCFLFVFVTYWVHLGPSSTIVHMKVTQGENRKNVRRKKGRGSVRKRVDSSEVCLFTDRL